MKLFFESWRYLQDHVYKLRDPLKEARIISALRIYFQEMKDISVEQAVEFLNDFGSDEDPIIFAKESMIPRDLLHQWTHDLPASTIYVSFWSTRLDYQAVVPLTEMVEDRAIAELEEVDFFNTVHKYFRVLENM